jgi:two-component system, NarL family, response regulator
VGFKVAIAADVDLTRRRATTALEQDGLEVVLSTEDLDGLAGTPSAALDAAVVAISDLRPGPAARAFRRMHPELPLVVICPPEGWGGLRRALENGVTGVVPGTELEARLAATVRAVCTDHAAVPRPQPPNIDVEALSPREKQVLGMVVMGFSNGEIAQTLHLAESTIKSHLSCAFSKLEVGSRKDAAALILDPHGGLGPGILAISSG